MKNKILLLSLAVSTIAAAAGIRAETLSALGRVLPGSGIVDVSGTVGDTIEAVLVKEGDWVEPGQSLARLSSSSLAAQQYARAEADLAGVRASTAQDLEVARLRVANAEAEDKIAKERFARINSARDSEFVSPDQIDDRTLNRQSAQLKLVQAQQNLASMKRESDKALRAAEADLSDARIKLASAEVRAPIKARVLKTFARPGSVVRGSELFKLGDTSRMIVVTEVYEADVLKVKPGQTATISSAALPKKMKGTVSSVSSLVYRNSLETLDPNQSGQSRIVEVTLQMDEAQPLDRLVLLQVDVVINL
jgi:HlyD family secretion protein